MKSKKRILSVRLNPKNHLDGDLLWLAKIKLREPDREDRAPAAAALEYILRRLGYTEPEGFWNDGKFDLWEPKVAPFRALSVRYREWQFLVGHSVRHCANLYAANPGETQRLAKAFLKNDFAALLPHLSKNLAANFLAGAF